MIPLCGRLIVLHPSYQLTAGSPPSSSFHFPAYAASFRLYAGACREEKLLPVEASALNEAATLGWEYGRCSKECDLQLEERCHRPAPENTNQMGGAWPTLACSHLASPLQMVPLKPSLATSSDQWFASLQVHAISRVSLCRA